MKWKTTFMNENIILRYLIKEGLNPKHKGFSYLVSAILINLFTEQPMAIGKIYTLVAQEYDTTAPRVERCIRTAIEAAWQNKKDEFNRPSNADFVAYTTLMLRLNEDIDLAQ